jgi:hypothetical protein
LDLTGTDQNQTAMSYSTSTLLTRNLQDVFGENGAARRRAAIAEIFTEDAVFYDSGKSVYRGRDEIDRIAGAVKATHPDSEPPWLNRWLSGTNTSLTTRPNAVLETTFAPISATPTNQPGEEEARTHLEK